MANRTLLPRLRDLPMVPAEDPVTYTTVQPDHQHALRKKHLNISESLLRPSVPRRRTTKPRSLRELPAAYHPVRFRLLESRFDTGERPDEFYESLYADVYGHARRFAHTHFGYGDLVVPEGEEGKLWLGASGRNGVGRELVDYVAGVARQDNLFGEKAWEAVIASMEERTAVVCGVLGRVLEKQVWDELLFGAGKALRRDLTSLDCQSLGAEGYERTRSRTLTINTVLGDEILPPRFWEAVDLLTMRTLTLLLPLLDLLDKHVPESRARALVYIHQDLHEVVAEAGYLNVCMRRSLSIFRFSRPEPGDWMHNDQAHDPICQEVYNRSKEAARVADEAQRGAAAANNNAEEQWNMVGGRVAKVKIVLWPRLERYSRVYDGWTIVGEDITEVLKSQVAYYCGTATHAADVAEARPTLREYVRAARRRERAKQWPVRWAAAVPRLVWLAMIPVLAFILVTLAHTVYWARERCVRDKARLYGDHPLETHVECNTWTDTPFIGWLGGNMLSVFIGLGRTLVGVMAKLGLTTAGHT